MHRRWRFLGPQTAWHQGGWDEALMIFGIPIVLFAVLRWLGIRRERKEAAAEDKGQRTGDGDG
jgi:hypothetical protein